MNQTTEPQTILTCTKCGGTEYVEGGRIAGRIATTYAYGPQRETAPQRDCLKCDDFTLWEWKPVTRQTALPGTESGR